MSANTRDSSNPPASFAPDSEGFIRHWLICGPAHKPYTGAAAPEAVLRCTAMDPIIGPCPQGALAGGSGPGGVWRAYMPGGNIFVEVSEFYRHIGVLDLYAVTDLVLGADAAVDATFWAVGAADLWLSGSHICRHTVGENNWPLAAHVRLYLRAGENRLAVRVQRLAARDTRHLFGLQLLPALAGAQVRLPGDAALTARLAAAEAWLAGIQPAGDRALAAGGGAPRQTTVGQQTVLGQTAEQAAWPSGATGVELPKGWPSVRVSVGLDGQVASRIIDIPANHAAVDAPAADRRQAALEWIASGATRKHSKSLSLVARRALGRWGAEDDQLVDVVCNDIDARGDCADFALAAMLRLYRMGTTPAAAQRIRRTALAFRYWDDEDGHDVMWFWTENHSLLFHGCQMIAGELFPDDQFASSHRTGRQQAQLGAERCGRWLQKVSADGFNEYLSATYMPVTAAGLMNLVDFAPSERMASQAAALMDEMFRQLAMHSFGGVFAPPQARVYRNVIYPQTSGSQAMLAWALPSAAAARSDWLAYLLTSPKYRPPAGLEALASQPADKTYQQDGVTIVLRKTAGHMLCSTPVPGGRGTHTMRPGARGYQQHLWHAALAADCHVFVNHPGASFDMSLSRPGYWYGNGSLPLLAQDGDVLRSVFDVGPEHPVGFTHAHWPADAFTRQEVAGQWAFGSQRDGLIALWCSRPLSPHDDVLVGRELRAYGRRVAWVCICADGAAAGGYEAFRDDCLRRQIRFDEATLTLHAPPLAPLAWR